MIFFDFVKKNAFSHTTATSLSFAIWSDHAIFLELSVAIHPETDTVSLPITSILSSVNMYALSFVDAMASTFESMYLFSPMS